MQAPSQQQHLQLVVSLDSELLVLQPRPSERESAKLLLTAAGRPESGDISRAFDDENSGAHPVVDSIEPVLDTKKKTKRKRRQAGSELSFPPGVAASTNQQSPPRQHGHKVAWSEHNSIDISNQRADLSTIHLPGNELHSSSTGVHRSTAENLAADVARRETPSRIFRMERHRVVTPAFPRQYVLDPLLSPLPLIQPTGGHRMSGGDLTSDELDRESYEEGVKPTNPAQMHPASETLLHPKHMLEIFRTRRMPLASPAYFRQHLRDAVSTELKGKRKRDWIPSRLQVTQWDKWNKEHRNDQDESEREAMTAVAIVPRARSPVKTATNGDKHVHGSTVSPTGMPEAAGTKIPLEDVESATPAFKRQRLREILSSPVEPNEHNVRQLRALAQRVNTSVLTSLGSEITRVRHEVHQTRQAMHSMIQQERERLPHKFLFQLPGGAAYCRHRMRRAVALWILEFEDNQRRMALMQWKAIVEHARFLERGEEYHRQATKRRLKVAIEYVLRGYQQQGLRKWIETTQVENVSWHCIAVIHSQVLSYVIFTLPQVVPIFPFGFQKKFVSTGENCGKQPNLYKVHTAIVDFVSHSLAIALQPSSSRHYNVCAQHARTITVCEDKLFWCRREPECVYAAMRS
ncbi:unnamed protein product [Phytophthora lilii]|uniref:Unnamed protein product n=1 Tax=Phytophthora lilii TaxID=2077276 RepID=A0A9W6U2M7_9STRA|nr:unnamed protein product [Phytophthora lilii]